MCIVTGSSRGIGAAVAKALGAQGCKVAVNYAGSKEKGEGRPACCEGQWAQGGFEASNAGIRGLDGSLLR